MTHRKHIPFDQRFGSIPFVTARVVDLDDEEQFPEMAIARAYNRGETPSPELIARADARYLEAQS